MSSVLSSTSETPAFELCELELNAHLSQRGPQVDLDGFLYRANLNRFDSTVYFQALPIIKRTPRGTWVLDWKKRFVLSDGRKRYAYPTRHEALVSFIHRKRKQIAILESQRDAAVEALAVAEATLKGGMGPLLSTDGAV